MPPRFCHECDYNGRTQALYCPDCGASFFPNARKGGELRPTEAPKHE